MVEGEPTIPFPQELSGQLNRIYARFVCSEEIRGHLDPGTPEKVAVSLYQFVAKWSFDSDIREGYRASISLRMSGWFSGARRRDNDERKP